jgi:hypothetical protein
MSWKQDITVWMAGILRMAIRICFFVDGILIALTSVWFMAKFLYFAVCWLDRVLFNAPW